MNIAILTWYPNQSNPQQPSGRGVWRVKACLLNAGNCSGRAVQRGDRNRNVLYLRTALTVKPRSRVNPRHLLGV